MNSTIKSIERRTCLLTVVVCTLLALSSFAHAETSPPELDFIGGYYDKGEYRCYSEPCFSIHRGTEAAASRDRPFDPRDWIPRKGSCQKNYTKVLAETSLTDIKYAKNKDCVFVVEGTWLDPYTGKKIDSVRTIALDHRISLKEAHRYGAAYWSKSQRLELASDPINLVPVSIDQRKLRKGRAASKWMPAVTSYWCDYVVHRELVVRKYQLRFPREEREFNKEIKQLYCKY